MAALTDEEELYRLALRLVPGLGTRRSALLARTLADAAGHLSGVAERTGTRRTQRNIGTFGRERGGFEDAAGQQHLMRAATARLVPVSDPRYPEPLRRIFDPPPVLFARGRVELLSSAYLKTGHAPVLARDKQALYLENVDGGKLPGTLPLARSD